MIMKPLVNIIADDEEVITEAKYLILSSLT